MEEGWEGCLSVPDMRGMVPRYAMVRLEARDRHGEKIDPMVEAWNAKDRQKAGELAPWDLIEDMFIFGSPEEMKERLDAYVEGGITLPILTPITTPDATADLIEALAPK